MSTNPSNHPVLAPVANQPLCRFFKRLKLDYPTPETTRASRRFVKAMKRLEVWSHLGLRYLFLGHKLTCRSQDIIPSSSPFLKNFLDLLKKIFVYDPSRRITAKEALQHPWFREPVQPDDGTEASRIRAERLWMEAASLESRRLPPIRA